MKHRISILFLCLTTVCAGLMFIQAGPALTPQSSNVREVLTNDSIIRLSKARFKEKTIIHLIRNSPTAFDISTARLIELKRGGVSEKIISEMIERQTFFASVQKGTSLRDDEFFTAEDEVFFNSGSRLSEMLNNRAKNGARNDTAKSSAETQVFGSGSGAQGRTRSRGFGNSGDQVTQSETLGTATVQIIRPQTESGELKLERAPKLDNQAIVEMVQAGFSEGTVLRKIELTQVDFDLSGKALSELRRNRVSERIIRAMSEAISEGKK